MREDAGVSITGLAQASGVPVAYLWRILNGEERPSIETYARLAAALGADLSAHLYPNTGPLIRDRHQARIHEGLLGSVSARWHPISEVGVRHPVRGWIDVVLHDALASVVVATEIESGNGRLEQQIRWSTAKADALPSWPHWRELGDPAISRMMIVRSTRQTRSVASEFHRQLRAAFPAHPADALAALSGITPWPGPSLLWARIEEARVRFLDGR